MEQAEFDAKLAAVVRREIPDCKDLTRVERLSGGASQETYRLTLDTNSGSRTLCMRRAAGGKDVDEEKNYENAPGLETEALLMTSARAAGVPEPEVHYVLREEDGLGKGFIMQWLDGETLGARIVKIPDLDDVRPKLAYQCGQILARIHTIDVDATGLRQHLSSTSPAQCVQQSWERYKSFGTPQPMIDYTGRWLMENLPKDHRVTLVHTDFRNGNVMVTPDGINAVLDWEIAHIGDPMRDLGWICTNSWRFGRTENPVGGFGAYADLFAGYEAESGLTVDPDHVKFWEVFGSFWWAVNSLGMAEHYRNGPDQSVERPAIGRRSSECQVDCINLLIPGPVELVEADADANLDMPSANELLHSVRDYLREDVMAATTGRIQFLARVASNSLDIVVRELAIGPEARQREHGRLRALLNADGTLGELRWQLVHALRNGDLALEDPALIEHLRSSVVNQIAIDQPRYSGFATALEHSGTT